jgi:CMP-N-acetylneuraminic acid synthetase
MVPARLGSKRLVRKNLQDLNGHPLISYAIRALQSIPVIDEVYVSTEAEEIAETARDYGATPIMRPPALAEDHIRSQDVFQHFASEVEFDILVIAQANSPNVQASNIEKGINLMRKNDLWEVRSVNNEGLENGAFWILKRNTIAWEGLSCYFGIVIDDAVDIHTTDDLHAAKEMME